MMENFKKQAVRLGADVRFGMITSVVFNTDGSNHRVTVDGTTEIECETVII